MDLRSKVIEYRYLGLILMLFGLLFASISLVNHYNFRTYTLDLGLYTNALYDYARFQFNDSLVFKEIPENLLADHFDLYLPLFSPLSYIFGTYTLLVVQIGAILWGAVGLFKLGQYWQSEGFFKYGIVLYFLTFFSIYTALGFDYHSNVVGAVIVPWLFLFVHKQQWVKAWLILLFICIGKENMGIWMFFVTLGLAFQFRGDQLARKQLVLMAVFTMIYTALVLGFVMPAFANAGVYPHFNYKVIGSSYSSALIYVVTHPWEAIKLLFINHSGLIENDGLKLQLWGYIFFSGFLILRKPIYVFMLLPVIGQKMYHDNPYIWSVYFQYSIEFAPLLTIGTFDVIRNVKSERWNKWLMGIAVMASLGVMIRLMDHRKNNMLDEQFKFYSSKHFKKHYYSKDAHRYLKLIPDDAIVSAQNSFVPHLALRETVYLFPTVKDAQYIFITSMDHAYPLSWEEHLTKIEELKADAAWELVMEENKFYLFKHKNSTHTAE